MNLTPAQRAALTTFQDFLKCPEEPVFLLRGYAGTGKTTLLKTLVQELGHRPANRQAEPPATGAAAGSYRPGGPRTGYAHWVPGYHRA
jgi:hypothetical protein